MTASIFVLQHLSYAEETCIYYRSESGLIADMICAGLNGRKTWT
jgi:hypothetical protein